MKNPYTVTEFLNEKHPDGSPHPISAMNAFWVNKLRKLGMEGQDLAALVTKGKRQAAAEKARQASAKKRADAAEKLKKERIEAKRKELEEAKILAEAEAQLAEAQTTV